MKTLGAAAAKTHFLALLDEVEQKRTPIIVTKKGRPVAKMIPMPQQGKDPIFGFYKGKIKILGDILKPRFSDEEIEEFAKREASHLR
ncbi:MAG: type II toxin-antitoxin system Phd/YefM family antitoxin [Acidobacteriaceae bacterium]|nr:type II toxin-antitoxin system Phd/YefM family antitoxin [Acidobacteriaceae bacterium]